jgi:hypothetical protein
VLRALPLEEDKCMSAFPRKFSSWIIGVFGAVFPSTLLLADASLCERLETLIQDPKVAIHLESRADGFVTKAQSREPESQKTARSFAVEVLKEHNLEIEVPRTNGYGLPEQ